MSATVTVLRGEEALTVVVDDGAVVEALDEAGESVTLTPDERNEALALTLAGVDETGR